MTLNTIEVKNTMVYLEEIEYSENGDEKDKKYHEFKIEDFDLNSDSLDQLSKVESVRVCYLTGDDIMGQDIDWGTFLIDNPLALRVDTKILKELVTDILYQIY